MQLVGPTAAVTGDSGAGATTLIRSGAGSHTERNGAGPPVAQFLGQAETARQCGPEGDLAAFSPQQHTPVRRQHFMLQEGASAKPEMTLASAAGQLSAATSNRPASRRPARRTRTPSAQTGLGLPANAIGSSGVPRTSVHPSTLVGSLSPKLQGGNPNQRAMVPS